MEAYRKPYSRQHIIICLLEEWKMQLDQNKIAGTALLDIFKVFHCTPHDPLIARLDIYGFNKEVLSFMYSHLKFRKQSVRINNKYNGFLEVISGVSQVSILDALLFFEMACSCLLKKASLHNYADDNTLSAYSSDLN